MDNTLPTGSSQRMAALTSSARKNRTPRLSRPVLSPSCSSHESCVLYEAARNCFPRVDATFLAKSLPVKLHEVSSLTTTHTPNLCTLLTAHSGSSPSKSLPLQPRFRITTPAGEEIPSRKRLPRLSI